CIAYAAVTRPNQVFGLSIIFVAWAALYYVQSHTKSVSKRVITNSTVMYSVVMLFPLWHNWHYGHQFLFFSKGSLQDPTTCLLLPSQLMTIFSSRVVQDIVVTHLGFLFATNPAAVSLMCLRTLWSIRSVGLIFIAASARLLWTKQTRLLVLGW